MGKDSEKALTLCGMRREASAPAPSTKSITALWFQAGPSGPPGHGTYLRLRRTLIRTAWPPVTEGLRFGAVFDLEKPCYDAGTAFANWSLITST